jgi:hypothetical protein
MKRGILRILDIFIIIALILLMYIVIEPQYKFAKINEGRIKLQSNMFAVKAGVERYIAFNEGKYPFELETIYNNVKQIEVPVNPYTKNKMGVSDLVKFYYDIPAEVEDDAVDGINGSQRGKPGQIGIGFFVPIGKDSIPTKIGIIGFDETGKPLILEEGKKKRVVVLIS